MRDIKFKYYFTLDDKVINTKTFIIDDIEDINFNTILFLNIDINKYSIEKMKLYRSQCTGLKDKNGIDIYEGDIVKHTYQTKNTSEEYLGSRPIYEWCYQICKVVYSLEVNPKFGRPAFVLQHKNNTLEDLSVYLQDIEVIGNIYENQELLKEGI